jgi:hypothetical protein
LGARRCAIFAESFRLHFGASHRDEAKENCDAFHDDPEWKKVKAESEAQGPLVDHIDLYFMDPAGYSALN